MHVQVTTLFTGFMFSESNLVACGQGYSYTIGEKDKKVENFNTIKQVEVWKVETSTAMLMSTSHWNMQTHHWLKYYVSMRLKDRDLPRGTVQGSVIIMTYFISAIWHGPDSGYFAFFVSAALCDIFGRVVARTAIAQRVQEIVNAHVIFVGLWMWNWFSLSYTGMCFPLLDFHKWNALHYNFDYCVHLIVPLGIILASLLPKARRASKTAPTTTNA